MRHTGLKIIAVTMVAAAALAFSGTGWAQSKGKADNSAKSAQTTASSKGSSGSAAAQDCISVRENKSSCIRARDGGNPLKVKAAK
ncbi:MAG TPA: hypothetical protein VL966_16645 [Alphaproteobacteria bacterium]|jgi:hypothetical protein|nr:hypothetical protein [Alphaproteobacteria bacterium]